MSIFIRSRWLVGIYASILLMFPLLAGCAPAKSSTAPTSTSSVYVLMAQGNPRSPTSLSLAALRADTGAVRWQSAQVSPITALFGTTPQIPPVVAGGLAFIHTDITLTKSQYAGHLIAFSTTDGNVKWQASLGALISQPVIANGVVYVSSFTQGNYPYHREVFALRAADGHELWHAILANSTGFTDKLTFNAGILYLSSSDLCFDYCSHSYVFALRGSDGAILWQRTFGGDEDLQAPVVQGRFVYFARPAADLNLNGNPISQAEIIALDAASGKTVWDYPSAFASVSIFADGSNVYTTNVGPPPVPFQFDKAAYRVVALNEATGVERWQNASQVYPSIIAVADGMIYTYEAESPYAPPYNNYELVARRAQDGQIVQHQHLGRDFYLIPGDPGTIYGSVTMLTTNAKGSVVSAQPVLYAFDALHGKVLWRHPYPVESSSSYAGGTPLIFWAGDTVFYPTGSTTTHTTGKTTLIALNDRDGAEKWRASLAGTMLGITAAP
jgi:outer membrane protein assembly factor BamB